jgi:hypothetical protein
MTDAATPPKELPPMHPCANCGTPTPLALLYSWTQKLERRICAECVRLKAGFR